jgi:hypothetical protein
MESSTSSPCREHINIDWACKPGTTWQCKLISNLAQPEARPTDAADSAASCTLQHLHVRRMMLGDPGSANYAE